MYRTIYGQGGGASHNATITAMQTNLVIGPVRKNVWGPMMWKFFHIMGRLLKRIVFSEERGRLTGEIFSFTSILIGTIPCPSCRNHAKEYYMKNGIGNGRDNSRAYEEWAFTFHNTVNSRLGKSGFSYEQLEIVAEGWGGPEEYIDQYLRAINAVMKLNVDEKGLRSRAAGLIGEINKAVEASESVLLRMKEEYMAKYTAELIAAPYDDSAYENIKVENAEAAPDETAESAENNAYETATESINIDKEEDDGEYKKDSVFFLDTPTSNA